MIKVTLMNNTRRADDFTTPDTTVREFLDKNSVNYAGSFISMDNCKMNNEDLDKTFESFGVTDKCFLSVIEKRDNASETSMIKVVVMNNTRRFEKITENNITVRDFMEANDIECAGAFVSLDNCKMRPEDMHKTFEEIGITDKCFLSIIEKRDNA